MANVSGHGRGQLILITGLLVAVAFVALALLLNTAIYTENLASRGTDAGGRTALEAEGTTVEAVGGLIEAENHQEHQSGGAVTDDVTEGIDAYERRQRLHRAQHGTVFRLSNPTLHEGWLLRQTDGTRNLTSAGGTTNWTLASGLDDTRSVALAITDQTALDDSDDPEEAFKVSVVGSGGNRWSVYIYADGPSTVIAVKNGSQASPTTDVCSPSATPTINLTAGTVDGESCPALSFAKGIIAPYDLSYTFGTRAEGTYELTVNTTATGADVESANFNDVATGTSPYQVPAVYSASLTLEYETTQLRYQSRVRVAPGEAA